MAALNSAATIPPGGEGAVEAKINIYDGRGPFAHTVTVETSDPQGQAIKLKLKAKVLVDVRVEPRRIDLERIIKGDSGSGSAEMETDMPDEVELTKVEVVGDHPDTSAKLVRKKGTTSVHVRFDSEKVGLVERRLKVFTTAKRRPVVEVEVVGYVVNLWEVSPRSLAFPQSEDGEEPRRLVKVTPRKQTRYKVLKVVDPSGAVATHLEKTGDHYSIDAVFKHPPKAWRGTIEITTDDPDQSSISVRYFVQKGRHAKSTDEPSPRAIKLPLPTN